MAVNGGRDVIGASDGGIVAVNGGMHAIGA